MVRTKAEAASTRASGAKAPRKLSVQQPSSSDKKKSTNSIGGNPYCPRETPAWQKEITKFFPKVETAPAEGSSAVEGCANARGSITEDEPGTSDGAGPSSSADCLSEKENCKNDSGTDADDAGLGNSCSQGCSAEQNDSESEEE